MLSVSDRAVLAALAPLLGASAAVFVSDEKTEVYLRDQRRSKAHRGLLPDPGAPCDDVISVDLSAVDPLVLDEDGVVKPVREIAGKPVSQVILGGDSGASLRDLLAAAALLKSKRVPPKLDLLVARRRPSARGARAVRRVGRSGGNGRALARARPAARHWRAVPSAERRRCFAAHVRSRAEPPRERAALRRCLRRDTRVLGGHGTVGDPRAFKRPVRVTVPRTLPTDDVLIVRKAKSKSKEAEGSKPTPVEAPKAYPFAEAQTLPIVLTRGKPTRPSVLVLESLDDVRWFARRAPELNDTVRAIIAPYIPSGIVPMLAGLGILALISDVAEIAKLRGEASLALPAAGGWNGESQTSATTGAGPVTLKWIALGSEREWTASGTARSPKALTRASAGRHGTAGGSHSGRRRERSLSRHRAPGNQRAARKPGHGACILRPAHWTRGSAPTRPCNESN